MTVKVFVDSNVIVYARDRTAREKRAAAIEWLAALATQDAAVVSPQVLNGSIRAFIDKMDAGRSELRTFVAEMAAWCTASIGPAVIVRALDIRHRWRFAWWDSLIVASALDANCRYLLTEDMHDDQHLDGITVINPFTHTPAAILSAP